MPDFNVGDVVRITATHIPSYTGAVATVTTVDSSFGGSYRLDFHEEGHRRGQYGTSAWGGSYLGLAPAPKKDGPPPPDRLIYTQVLGVVQEACEMLRTTPAKVIEDAFAEVLKRAQREQSEAERRAEQRLSDIGPDYTFRINSDDYRRPLAMQWADLGRPDEPEIIRYDDLRF